MNLKGCLRFFRREEPALPKGPRVFLRHPKESDYKEWAALRAESRGYLEPWEPKWTADELERSAWRNRLDHYKLSREEGRGAAFLIFETASSRMVGGITLNGVRRGVAQSGHIGYWMGEKFAGQGYMTEAVRALAHYSFVTLRLHRVEAACIPGNKRSIRVLEKAGFQREGLLRSYLRINDVWQDHYLYALIDDDPGGVIAKD